MAEFVVGLHEHQAWIEVVPAGAAAGYWFVQNGGPGTVNINTSSNSLPPGTSTWFYKDVGIKIQLELVLENVPDGSALRGAACVVHR